MGTIYKRTYRDKKTGAVKESSIYWVSYYRNGRQLRESANTAVYSEAKRLLGVREGDIAKGIPISPKMGRIKFQEMAEDALNDYRTNKRRSLKSQELQFRLHLIPFFGEARACAITTADIRRYIKGRQEHGAKNSTINRSLAAFKRAFSLAKKDGHLIVAPYVPMLKESNVRTGFFERDQFESVLNHLPIDLQQPACFSYITGWRKSEVLDLQWPQVDFQAGLVRLEPGTTKNDEARVFPFTSELRQLLEAQKAKADALKKQGIICPWVFFRSGKKRKGTKIRYFRRAWRTACRIAGVPGRLVHDFRRTAVRNLVRAGVPERVAMKLTGHKTRSVFDRYNIVSEGDLFDAARKLEGLSGIRSERKGHSSGDTSATGSAG